MKYKLFFVPVMLAICLPLGAQGFEIGLGYQRGVSKDYSAEKSKGETVEEEVTNSLAFNLRYYFLPTVAFTLKASVGSPDKLVWRNPAYDYIKDKTSESQLAPGGWGGFTNEQLKALFNYLPNKEYTFTSDDGTLIALDVLIGAGMEIPLVSQLALAADLGITCHYQSVSYKEYMGKLISGKDVNFSSSVTNTTFGLGLGLGVKYRFTTMFYAELGGSAAWDFIHTNNITVKVGDETIIDVSGKTETTNILNFGAPYVLVGIRL
jgi:hypothetical protein